MDVSLGPIFRGIRDIIKTFPDVLKVIPEPYRLLALIVLTGWIIPLVLILRNRESFLILFTFIGIWLVNALIILCLWKLDYTKLTSLEKREQDYKEVLKKIVRSADRPEEIKKIIEKGSIHDAK